MENIFILVIMMLNGKERKIIFKKIFIWKKNYLMMSGRKMYYFFLDFVLK